MTAPPMRSYHSLRAFRYRVSTWPSGVHFLFATACMPEPPAVVLAARPSGVNRSRGRPRRNDRAVHLTCSEPPGGTARPTVRNSTRPPVVGRRLDPDQGSRHSAIAVEARRSYGGLVGKEESTCRHPYAGQPARFQPPVPDSALLPW